MRKQVLLCLKVAWTVAAVIILLVDTSICGSSDQACSTAGGTMLLFMGLLTFPSGLICVLVSVVVCGSIGTEYPSSYLVGWLIMACGGCLQWFVIVPQCLEEPRLTILDLGCKTAAPADINQPLTRPEPLMETKPEPAPMIGARLNLRPRNRQKWIKAFDKLGRSPLERVINR
ncbi:MAG TPA: hypothetical protein VE961_24785 [Pyrinomonadaceae bacterium]|nr:hypothetical protein [Pyrinomonadaceae bacterium]